MATSCQEKKSGLTGRQSGDGTMKGLILAVMFSLIYLGLITAVFRYSKVTERATLMARLFVITLAAFGTAHWMSPASLWLLPEYLVEPFGVVDLAFGLLLYAAVVFGGILQVYAQADRGFSLRILLDAAASPDAAVTARGLVTGYSGGAGIKWMCQRRIDGLVDHGFIQIVDGRVRNLPKGQRAALVFGWLRRFLRLD